MTGLGTRLLAARLAAHPPRRRRRAPARELVTRTVDRRTDVVEVFGELDQHRREGLAGALHGSVASGALFVVVDLRGFHGDEQALVRMLETASDTLTNRGGGLAVVGPCPTVETDDGPVPLADSFATTDEALAGVRGRLTPPRSLPRVPRRRP